MEPVLVAGGCTLFVYGIQYEYQPNERENHGYKNRNNVRAYCG